MSTTEVVSEAMAEDAIERFCFTIYKQHFI